jgi:hypothetical protein
MERHVGPEAPSELRVSAHGSAIVITVHGILDEQAVRILGSAATCALNSGSKLVRVDLRNLEAFTPAGASLLAELQDMLPPEVSHRVRYHAGSQTSRDVLLAAYAGSG